jgi:hypothetical protein
MRFRVFALIGVLLVSGCAANDARTPVSPVALPPVVHTPSGNPTTTPPLLLAPITSPTSPEAGELAHPTTTPTCQDSLKFVADLTVPDGTIVARGAVIDKRWQVENNGTCNWDERYRLKITSGADLGLQAEQALFPARSGAVAVIRMQYLAPSMPGVYRSAWQAVGPQGDPFGDVIYVEIRVN